MKALLLFAGLIAGMLTNAPTVQAAGMYEGFPDATFPLSGNECVPADTNLSGGRSPQTQCIDIDKIRGYVSAINAQEVTSATSVSLDLSVSDTFSLTLHVSGALSAPTNTSDGQVWTFAVGQGPGTGWSLGFDSDYFRFAGNTYPTQSTDPGDIDIYRCVTLSSVQYCQTVGSDYTAP